MFVEFKSSPVAVGAFQGKRFSQRPLARALHLAGRASEALELIEEAKAVVERSEARMWCAELHRLRGVFLAAIGANKPQIEGFRLTNHMVGGVGPAPGFYSWLFPGEPRRRR